MAFPIEILFRDSAPVPEIEDELRTLADKLEHVYDRILACEVAIEAPHHQRNGRRHHVRVTLTVPGTRIVISRDPGLTAAHESLRVAVHDAMHAARRRLEAWVKRDLRREVKPHGGARPLPR